MPAARSASMKRCSTVIPFVSSGTEPCCPVTTSRPRTAPGATRLMPTRRMLSRVIDRRAAWLSRSSVRTLVRGVGVRWLAADSGLVRFISAARSDERGIGLLIALGVLIVLGITVASTIGYTTANTRSTALTQGRDSATVYSESGVNYAVGVLAQQIASSNDPSAANLLGCNGASGPSDTVGPSNCTTPTVKVLCISGGTACTAGTDKTATVYGYFSGTNGGTFLGRTVPASTWLIVGNGYANNPATGGVTSRTQYAQITVNPLNAGKVASVWNHIFVTSPLVAGTCSLDWSGNNISANVPVYVIGNLCLGGSTINETTQPVDVMVGGYVYLSSGGVGNVAAITSGVANGGCSSSSNGSGATSCTGGSWNFHVKASESFISRDAPEESSTDITHDYSTFDPGPNHPCVTGNHPYAALASTTFESTGNTAVDISAGTFTLTPASSYSCNSTSGTTVGQLQWDNTAKALTVNGSVFIDGNLVINQSLLYSGTGVIEVSGTITFSGNNLTVCAVAGCTFTNWQGTSGNNQMLTLAALQSNTTAITFLSNAQTFQGSLWTQPSSSLTFVKNGDQIQGPISIGKFDSTFNNATLEPLPVIKNMPIGAPLPPNVGA